MEMDKKKKFYIRIGNLVEEVIEEVHREYYKMEWRERYLEERDNAHSRVFYSQFDNIYDDISGEEMIADSFAENICEFVITRIRMEELRVSLTLLSDEELDLIVQLFFEEKSQRKLAIERGIPLMTLSNRKDRALKKLRKYLDYEK